MNLARYIIRVLFSSERMTYIPVCDTTSGSAKVIYQSKSNASSKTFDALDWLAQLTTNIPNPGGTDGPVQTRLKEYKG